MVLSRAAIERIVRRALDEDVGTGDVTTLATVSPSARTHARIVARVPGVIAGLSVVDEVFRQVDQGIHVRRLSDDGARVGSGDVIAEVDGPARGILTGERVALNFLQRLSGVATMTARFVELVKGTGARVIDTRKTTPGMRILEKYAVTVGGGHNHRMGLYDAVLIKDNHIIAVGGIAAAVRMARAYAPHTMTVTVECENLDQVCEALAAGADTLLLDNMTNEVRAAAVKMAKQGASVLPPVRAAMGSGASGAALAEPSRRVRTEASGGITQETAAAIARTGVDYLSIGALTHSAPALDISLDFVSVGTGK